MAERATGWLRGCAFGCAGLLVIGVVAVLSMTLSLRSTFDQAHAERLRLEERLGAGQEFTPAADGTVDAGRIEAFLAVRDALADIRTKIEAADEKAADFERYVEEEEPSAWQALPAIARVTRSVFDLPFLFAELEQTRNQALLEREMSLDEYIWLYVVAYNRRLGDPQERPGLFSGSPDNERIRGVLRTMLQRQLEAAKAADEAPGWVSDLTAEVDALDRDPERLPWQDGLPEATADGLAPYRQRLDATFSAPAAEFELLDSEVRHGGLNIQLK
jgi:hypothetical protein